MKVTFEEKSHCSGCTACQFICPKQCISMQRDEEGFLYPDTDQSMCIDCGLCRLVCPMTKKTSDDFLPFKQYACQYQNENVRKFSTSGGLFSAFAEKILASNGTVFAAGFDSELHVVHKCAKTLDQLTEMRMSKYVQSELKKTIYKLHEEAETGLPVLFVGTPCQVAGVLQSFLGNVPENVYTADLACYGVPSPGLYDRWLDSISKHYKSCVKQVYFRDKKYGYSGVNVKLILENGKVLEDRADVKSYGKTMFSKIGLRPSCYQCPLRGRAKHCDFTFGDFWEIDQYSPEMNDDKGTTLLNIYSEKGFRLFQSLEQVRSVPIGSFSAEEAAVLGENEKRLNKTPHPKRKDFFYDSSCLSYDALIKKYLPVTWTNKCAIVFKPFINSLPFSRQFFVMLKRYKIKTHLRKADR